MFNRVYESGIARELLKSEPELYLYYVHLLSYRNNKTYLCCPSYKTLNADLGLSNNKIKDFNDRLKAAGALYWAKYKDGNKKEHIKYFFPLESKSTMLGKILALGTMDLRTIKKNIDVTDEQLENMGFVLDRKNHKIKALATTPPLEK